MAVAPEPYRHRLGSILPALNPGCLVGLLFLGLLLAAPLPAHAVDLEPYAGIADDESNPLPAHASEEDKRLLDELLRQQRLELQALPGPPPGTIRTPSEYEPLAGVLIRWGSYNALLTEFAVGITAASANYCTDSATPYACCTGSGTGTCDTPSTEVWVSVENASTQASAYATLEGAGADMSRVEFIVYDGDSIWIRDYGPRYIFEDSTRTIIDFTYVRPTRPKDDAFNEALATLWDEPIYDMGIVRADGNLHLVSTGDAFVSSLALDPDEDGTDEYTEAEIEQIYLDYLNLDVTIYQRLPDSIDSTGHIDMWMLPLSDTDMLVSEFSGGTGKSVTDAGAADLLSRGYTVWRVPAWTSGGTHYTYTNAAIVNNKVFIPWYSGYSSQNATALGIYRAAMPDYAIIQVDTSSIISDSGAIHCAMKHVPAGPDDDGDGIAYGEDNCPLDINADQADLDEDGSGDVCDPDDDGDQVVDIADNCPVAMNTDQADSEGDGVGNVCDNCVGVANADQADTGGLNPANVPDGIGDVCQCGDVNGSGGTDSTDALLITRASLNLSVGPTFLTGRCNVTSPGSGTCTSTDGLLVNRASLGLSVPNLATHFAGLCAGEVHP